MKGIDISSHQAGFKLQNAKNNGYEFAILRGGFTGWGTGVSYNKDTSFDEFYKQAKQIGMPIGVYWYSCADNKQKGIDEANFLYNNCLKNKQFEFPIYIDVEEPRWQQNKKQSVTDAIIGFCETLEKLGFFVGVYASTYWFNYQIDTNRLNAYTKWVANWSANKPYFNYNAFDLWQNSSNGNIAGTIVDTNIAYKDFPSVIKNAGLNGYSKKPVKKPIDVIAKEVINGEWGNGEERKRRLEAAGYNYREVQDKVNKLLENTLQIGTKVRTIKSGKEASDGSGKNARTNLVGTIKNIVEGAKYPYLVSNYGWYKADALEIL